MAQYIPKSAVVAEIERRIKEIEGIGTFLSPKGTLTNLLCYINTLEVKEEILDKEGKTKLMRKCVHKAYKRGYDMGVLQTTNKMNHNTKEVDLDKELDAMITPELKFHKALPSLFDVAKHFFELGMAVSKV